MTRHQRANRFLWASVGFFIAGVFSVAGFAFTFDNGDPYDDALPVIAQLFFWGTLLFNPAWIGAVAVGVGLKIRASIIEQRIIQAGQRYAQLHNWQPISSTTWKNYRRANVVMTVDKMYGQDAYMLLIDQAGEYVSTDGFENSVFALQFGDFLWDNVLSTRERMVVSEVQQVHREWVGQLALAPASSSRPPSRPPVSCPNCGRVNTPQARFCIQCGTPRAP